MLIKYAYVLICICAGEGSWWYYFIHQVLLLECAFGMTKYLHDEAFPCTQKFCYIYFLSMHNMHVWHRYQGDGCQIFSDAATMCMLQVFHSTFNNNVYILCFYSYKMMTRWAFKRGHGLQFCAEHNNYRCLSKAWKKSRHYDNVPEVSPFPASLT